MGLSPGDLLQALRLFQLAPVAPLMAMAAALLWHHQTHRRYDQLTERAVFVIVQSVRQGRSLSLREIARRASCSRSTARNWIRRMEGWGWLVRLGPSGQALMPHAHVPRLAERDGWHATGRYAIRWTPQLVALLDPQWQEAVAMAWHLARAGHSVELLRAWLRWPQRRGHQLIRDAYARHLRRVLGRRRRCRRAERAAARRAQPPPAPRGRGPLAPEVGAIATRIENLHRGEIPVEGSSLQAPRGPFENPRTRTRAREGPPPQAQLLERATALTSNHRTAQRLLAEIEWKAGQVGELHPASLLAELLRLAEAGPHSLDWWAGRYEAAADSVREAIAEAQQQHEPCFLVRPAAVARWRCLHGWRQGPRPSPAQAARPQLAPELRQAAEQLHPRRRADQVLRGQTISPTGEDGYRPRDAALLRALLHQAESRGHLDLAAKLRAWLHDAPSAADRCSPAAPPDP